MQIVIEKRGTVTNGDVIKAVFPNTTVVEHENKVDVLRLDGYTIFFKEWWNAPYERSEENEHTECTM